MSSHMLHMLRAGTGSTLSVVAEEATATDPFTNHTHRCVGYINLNNACV